MCKKGNQSQCRGYFSLDAALAIVIVVFAFSSFALVSFAAARTAASQSSEVSSSLLALRLSSFVLSETAPRGGLGQDSYSSANEIDAVRLQSLDLQGILSKTGRKFASVSVKDENGEERYSAAAGEAQNQTYCASRLAILSGEIVRLEACTS